MDKYNTNLQLSKEKNPKEPGVYLARGVLGEWNKPREMEVYEHPVKGLCCFQEDFGSAGTGVWDETDCHVSVQFSGLEFIKKIKGVQNE